MPFMYAPPPPPSPGCECSASCGLVGIASMIGYIVRNKLRRK